MDGDHCDLLDDTLGSVGGLETSFLGGNEYRAR